MVVAPELPAGHRVEGDDVVRRADGVQDPVDHERRGFELIARAQRADLEHPLQLEVLHVGRRDLIERAMAAPVVGTGVGQPVVRLFVRIADAIGGDRLLRRQRRGSRHKQSEENGALHRP
jgi:hypothetical protein